jgi:hypothetical protein
MRRLLILLFVLNLISAALFIVLVNRPVYDDPLNMFDVHNYATKGLSVGALLSHRNSPGPTSFLWLAAGVRLLGGQELRDARIAVLISWILLAAGILVGAQHTRFPQLWLGALLATLIFPHSMEATATVLTEGPSLFFGLLGALTWIECFSSLGFSSEFVPLMMLGGLFMGLAVTCRQYYLALLPAAALFALIQWRARPSSEKLRSGVNAIFSLALAVVPVLLMVLVWKGISSPAIATGASYNHMWTATVGLNLSRPIIVAFYVAVYLVPFTFPAMFCVKTSRRRIALSLAVFGAVAISYFSSIFLQPGPLSWSIRFSSRLPHAGTVLFTLASVAALYNVVTVGFLLWDQRQALLSCPPALFSLFVVLFFIAEQVGVGGNLPFYDRYVLQLAPFLGIIAFFVLPRLTPSRLLALAALSVLSHIMLWRFAFAS